MRGCRQRWFYSLHVSLWTRFSSDYWHVYSVPFVPLAHEAVGEDSIWMLEDHWTSARWAQPAGLWFSMNEFTGNLMSFIKTAWEDVQVHLIRRSHICLPDLTLLFTLQCTLCVIQVGSYQCCHGTFDIPKCSLISLCQDVAAPTGFDQLQAGLSFE